MRRRPTTTDEVPGNGLQVIRRVAPYLWPEGQNWAKRRVVFALIALVIAKLVAVGTPVFYKAAVDALADEGEQAAWMLGAGAVGLTVAYGMARLMNVGFQQLRDALFAKVGYAGPTGLSLHQRRRSASFEHTLLEQKR